MKFHQILLVLKVVSMTITETKTESTSKTHYNNSSREFQFQICPSTYNLAKFVKDYVSFHVFPRVIFVSDTPENDQYLVPLFTTQSMFVRRVRDGLLITLSTECSEAKTGKPALLLLVISSMTLLEEMTKLPENVYRWMPSLVIWCGPGQLPLLTLPFDNWITFAIPHSTDGANCLDFRLEEVYSMPNKNEIYKNNLGQWTNNGGLIGASRDRFMHKMDLQGHLMNCLFVSVSEFDDNFYDFQKILLPAWISYMNVSCRYSQPSDRTYGSVTPDGSWSGMVGEVLAGNGDVILAQLDNTVERATAVKFLLPITVTGKILITKKISSMDSNWTRYTKEFSWGVWLVVGGAVVVLTAMIYLVTEFSPTQTQTLTLAEAATQVISAFASQSSTVNYTSFSSRCTILVVFTATYLITSHYSSWLYAMLTVTVPVYPFSGFQSILDDKTYAVGTVDGWSTKNELELSEDNLFKRVWQELVEPTGIVNSLKEGLEKALSERFIMILSKGIYYSDEVDSSLYTILPGTYFQRKTGFATTFDSPFIEVFNKGLLKMHETGVVNRALRVVLPSDEENSVGGVTLEQTSSVFTALFLMMLLSIIILLIEKIVFNK